MSAAKLPKIAPEHATVIAAILGLVGALTAAVLTYLAATSPGSPSQAGPDKASVPSKHPASSHVELVDVSAAERGKDTVFLDIKIRNLGEETSILKRAIAHVRNWRVLSTCTVGAPLPASSTYQLKLPVDPSGKRFDVPVELSDSLPAKEPYRVTIETGLDVEEPFIDGILFQLNLELQFDASESVTSESLLISLPGELSPPETWEKLAAGSAPSFTRDCAQGNLADLNFMLTLPGRRSADLEHLTTG